MPLTMERPTVGTESANGAISEAEQAQGLSTRHISGSGFYSGENILRSAEAAQRIGDLYSETERLNSRQYSETQSERIGILELHVEGNKARFTMDAGLLDLRDGSFVGNPKYDEDAKQRAQSVADAEVDEIEAAKVEALKAQAPNRRGTQIVGRSRKARKRMLNEIAELKIKDIKADDMAFITLTFPDAYYGDNASVKTSLDNFRREFTERYPELLTYWSMEEQIRKSGTRQGEPVVHFHLVTIGWQHEYARRKPLRIKTVRKAFRTWISATWSRCVVAQVDGLTLQAMRNHAQAGTKVEQPRGVRNALAYIGKYIGKGDAEAIEMYYATHPEQTHWTGRTWGKWNHRRVLADGTTLLERYTSAVVRYAVHSVNIDRVMGYFRWKAGVDYIEEELGVKLRLDRLSILIDPDELRAWCERQGVGLPEFENILGMDAA